MVKDSFNDFDLNRMLSGFCSLHVEIVHNKLGEMKMLKIEGEVFGSDLEIIATKLCPRTQDFLSVKPKWVDGNQGLIQLIIMMLLEEKLLAKVAYV